MTRVRSTQADNPRLASALLDYIRDLPGDVALMQRHLRSGATPDLKRVVHQLRGSGGGYGFSEVTRLAERAETAIISEVPADAIAEHIAELMQYMRLIEGYDRAAEDVEENTCGQPSLA